MPAGSTWLNRDKPRPFALATPCSPGSPASLVYGSTRDTERRCGAAWIDVLPIHAGVNRNGLRSRTYFYPGVLHLIAHGELPPQAGFLGKSVHALKAALHIALGIGWGSCGSVTSPPGSCRGRIVELSVSLAAEIGSPFALVLTEPRYSVIRNYQIIVPIVGAGASISEYDVRVCTQRWMRVFDEPVDAVAIPVPIAMSVWHVDDIARETEYVVDDQTLGEIDRHLCAYFSLPEAGPEG